MFLGSYKTLFTGKNRILLPKKFRKELKREDKLYLVKGLDGEIWGFESTQWWKEAKDRLSVPLTEAKGREIRRKFFPQAEECNLDSQGRFVISEDLIKYAQITNQVLLIGAGDHFEIWNPNNWDEFLKE